MYFLSAEFLGPVQGGRSKPNVVIDHRVCCSTVLARPVQYKKGEVGIRAKKQAFREEKVRGGKTTKDGQLHEETDKRTRLLYGSTSTKPHTPYHNIWTIDICSMSKVVE